MTIEKTILQSDQPSSHNVLWARPMNNGLLLYVYNNGKWCPVSLPDDKGSSTTDDDSLMSLNADNIEYLMADGSTTSLSKYISTLAGNYDVLNNSLSGKVDKETGKGLSTNDYSTTEKNKLAGIAEGAEVNVQPDWNVTDNTSDAYIKNKPTIPTVPTKVSAFTNDAGYLTSHQSLDGYAKETDIVQADWTEADTSSKAYIKNKPSVYTQSETDSKLAAKADASTTYTKTDVDTKVNGKADSSTVTTLSDSLESLKSSAATSEQLSAETARAKAAEEANAKNIATNSESIAANVENIASNTERIATLENKTLLDQLSYGVEWDITKSTPKCTRVGNMQMHKTLPIQNSLKGCIFTKDGVKYYLDPNDWSKKADGTEAKLDGTDGDVGVHHMKFYIRSWTSVDGDSNRKQVRISPFQIDGSWYEVKEGVISAYCATVDTTDSTSLKARSVVSDATNMRGGGNRSANDSLDDYQTDLGKPRTATSRANFRTYARNNGYELLDYTNYKNCIYWLFVIEYATFYNQDTFTDELTSEGYHQGGLGVGVTNVNYWLWYWFTGNVYPFVKNGYTDSLGNNTGEIELASKQVTKASVNQAVSGDRWENQSGVTSTKNTTDSSMTITAINFGSSTKKNICGVPMYWATGKYTFEVSGITDAGITLNFKDTSSNVVAILDADGTVSADFEDMSNAGNYRYIEAVIPTAANITCNIVIKTTTVPENKDITIEFPAIKVNRYRGIEMPFGHIWLNVDGFLGHIGDNASKEEIYVTDNPDYYSDSDYSNMRYLGTMPDSDWTKTLNIGEQADIMPESIGGTGNTYMTDCCYKGSSINIYYTLLLGGSARSGSCAGLGCFSADAGVGWAKAFGGCRLCLIIK